MNKVHRSLAYGIFTAAALLGLGASCDGGAANAGQATAGEEETAAQLLGRPKPGILLVHGSFADALSWQQVTGLLQQHGYTVAAVGAHTVEIDSSHVSFISHPHAVVRLIEDAAHSVH